MRMKQSVAGFGEGAPRGAEPLETRSVRLSKQSVTVKLVALTWIPRWQDGAGQSRPAWQ